MNEKLELIRNNFKKILAGKLRKLEVLKQKYQDAIADNDEEEKEELEISINELLFQIVSLQSKINNMREISAEDVEERKNIYRTYTESIKESISEDVPIVFHGNNNIGLVEEIIKSGGLFTPEERNVKYRSLATQIDVTQRGNIKTSLEFADPGVDTFMPYGAIFAFMPKDEEKEIVLKTGEGTEVPGGVQSISFKTEPERLIAIITTTENVERLRKVAQENGIDSNKVLTHEQFLKMCKEKFKGTRKM